MMGSHPELYAVSYETYLGFKPHRDAVRCLNGINRDALVHGKSGWVEKTPKHIVCLPRLFELVPGARVILMLRDGRDVAVSIQRRSGSLEKGIRRWVDQNLEGQKYWNNPAVKVVKYEQLIQSTPGTLKELLVHAGIPYSEECLRYHQKSLHFYSDKLEKPSSAAGEDHAQYRNWQINQPVFDGRGRWHDLSTEEKKLIKDIGGKMLIDYGYARNADW